MISQMFYYDWKTVKTLIYSIYYNVRQRKSKKKKVAEIIKYLTFLLKKEQSRPLKIVRASIIKNTEQI